MNCTMGSIQRTSSWGCTVQIQSMLTTEQFTSDTSFDSFQKDDTASGKVIELVCLLKRKDNRTYQRFLQLMEENGGTGGAAVAALLRNKNTKQAELMSPDPRTVHVLESTLCDVKIGKTAMNGIAACLVPRQVYQDEVQRLQERLTAMEKFVQSAQVPGRGAQAQATSGPSSRQQERDSGTCSRESTGASLSISEEEGKPSPLSAADYDTILKMKDDLIRRKDDEYNKLRQILSDTQNEMESVLNVNSHMSTIISEMNAMQLAAATPRHIDKSTAMLEMEQQLDLTQDRLREMQEEMTQVSQELAGKEKEVEKVTRRENRYKAMLGLGEQASQQEVEQRIAEIIRQGSMRQDEVEKIRRELFRVRESKEILQEKMTSLIREKDKVAFHMRQQDLMIKKMSRVKTSKDLLSKAENVLATSRTTHPLLLPAIERAGSQISLLSRRNSNSRSVTQFCMFCRSEYQPIKAQSCRVHFRPLRNAVWTCCKDECHRSAGCLSVPHFYIEITASNKMFLTDGARYMELT